ncbi:unnamed protein product [Effrenium voratum]|nr:unnamed protein product [Effrenium voratum]
MASDPQPIANKKGVLRILRLSRDGRYLRRSLEKCLDATVVREEQELLPGGDIRLKGNQWVRKAFSASRVSRVPRELEVRRLISNLCRKHNLCTHLPEGEERNAWVREQAARCHQTILRHKKISGRPKSASASRSSVCVDDLETQPMFPDNMEMNAYGAALHVANDANPNPLGDASEGEASEEESATDDPAMEADDDSESTSTSSGSEDKGESCRRGTKDECPKEESKNDLPLANKPKHRVDGNTGVVVVHSDESQPPLDTNGPEIAKQVKTWSGWDRFVTRKNFSPAVKADRPVARPLTAASNASRNLAASFDAAASDSEATLKNLPPATVAPAAEGRKKESTLELTQQDPSSTSSDGSTTEDEAQQAEHAEREKLENDTELADGLQRESRLKAYAGEQLVCAVEPSSADDSSDTSDDECDDDGNESASKGEHSDKLQEELAAKSVDAEEDHSSNSAGSEEDASSDSNRATEEPASTSASESSLSEDERDDNRTKPAAIVPKENPTPTPSDQSSESSDEASTSDDEQHQQQPAAAAANSAAVPEHDVPQDGCTGDEASSSETDASNSSKSEQLATAFAGDETLAEKGYKGAKRPEQNKEHECASKKLKVFEQGRPSAAACGFSTGSMTDAEVAFQLQMVPAQETQGQAAAVVAAPSTKENNANNSANSKEDAHGQPAPKAKSKASSKKRAKPKAKPKAKTAAVGSSSHSGSASSTDGSTDDSSSDSSSDSSTKVNPAAVPEVPAKEKKSCKKSSVDCVQSKDGWKVETRKRMSGKLANSLYKVYIGPDERQYYSHAKARLAGFKGEGGRCSGQAARGSKKK